jgi:hypothetical protein
LPTNSNPAFRTYQLLTRANQQADNKSTLDAWAATFGVNSVDFMDSQFETVRLLGLLKDELTLAKGQMQDTGALDEDSYSFAFGNALQAVDISYLASPWEGLKRNLTGETLRMLKICSEITPAQEAPIDEEQIANLDADLVEFEHSVLGSDLPAEIKAFIVDQIHVIRRAILEYRIIGSRAFRKASLDFAANIAEHRDLIEQNSDRKEVKTLAAYWRRFVDIAYTVSTLENAIEAGRKILELGEDVVDKI